MPGGVSIPTEIISEIYPDLPRHAGKGMAMHWKYFRNLPFHTKACQEVYPYPPQLFRQFMVIFRGKPEKVWAFAQSVSGIYRSLPSHSRRCIHAHRNCFGNFSKPTEACWQRYGMHRKCFGNLPFPTKACWEVYPYPPKLFWQFMVTLRSSPAKVWACTENVSVIYHCLPTDVRRCIHTHRNCFGNLWWPSTAGWQRYHAPKMFR